ARVVASHERVASAGRQGGQWREGRTRPHKIEYVVVALACACEIYLTVVEHVIRSEGAHVYLLQGVVHPSHLGAEHLGHLDGKHTGAPAGSVDENAVSSLHATPKPEALERDDARLRNSSHLFEAQLGRFLVEGFF